MIRHGKLSVLLAWVAIGVATVQSFAPGAAWAIETPDDRSNWNTGSSTAVIPTTPSAPPVLFKRTAPENFQCQRNYTYEGKNYGCDSNVRSDGEGLRPLFKDVPEANAQLNVYQRNRMSLQNTAYAGSLGLLIMIGGFVTGAGTGRSLLILGGGTLFSGSLLYGFTSTKANENNLAEAVRLHNQAKPDKPIELQFSTGIGF